MSEPEDYFYNSIFKFISVMLPKFIIERFFKGRVNIGTYLAGGRIALAFLFCSLILAMFIYRFVNTWFALIFLMLAFLISSFYDYSLKVRRMHDVGMSVKEFCHSSLVGNWYKSFRNWSRLNNWEIRELSGGDNRYGKRLSTGVDWKAVFGFRRP